MEMFKACQPSRRRACQLSSAREGEVVPQDPQVVPQSFPHNASVRKECPERCFTVLIPKTVCWTPVRQERRKPSSVSRTSFTPHHLTTTDRIFIQAAHPTQDEDGKQPSSMDVRFTDHDDVPGRVFYLLPIITLFPRLQHLFATSQRRPICERGDSRGKCAAFPAKSCKHPSTPSCDERVSPTRPLRRVPDR